MSRYHSFSAKASMFWDASLEAQPLYKATYAIWERRHIVETIFDNVIMSLNTHTASSAASSYAFCARQYLGVAAYVLRWGLGRVGSLGNVLYAKCICICYRESSLNIVRWWIFKSYVLHPVCLNPSWLTCLPDRCNYMSSVGEVIGMHVQHITALQSSMWSDIDGIT